MYETFLNSGIRLDELIHLKFKDFDSKRRVLHVRARSSGGGSKGDKARDISIPDLLLKKYEAYLADYRLKIDSKTDYVFVSEQYGTKLTNGSIWSRMNRLQKKLNIHIHPHKFRATYATHLHQEGESVVVISLLLGHENLETTMRYISVTEEEKRKAIRSTYLGRKSEQSKRIEQLNREKEDLLALVDDLIKQNETLLERIKRLNI